MQQTPPSRDSVTYCGGGHVRTIVRVFAASACGYLWIGKAMSLSSSPPVRLAILNDYPIVVHGLTGMLASFHSRVTIVELAASLLPVSEVDVVFYDAFASGATEPELRRLCDRSKVIFYTWASEPAATKWAEGLGAAAVLSKGLDVSDVLAAIETVHRGLTWSNPDGRAEREVQQVGDWPGRGYGLSPREGEILALIGQGLTNEAIAAQLFLSINSVKTYIRSAYRKLGVTRRMDAMLWFVEHGFIREEHRAFLARP